MLTRNCDSCGDKIGETASRFEVNIVPELAPSADEFDDEPVTLLAEFTTEAEFHFCSPACLAAWSMGRHLDGHPES